MHPYTVFFKAVWERPPRAPERRMRRRDALGRMRRRLTARQGRPARAARSGSAEV